MARTRSPFAQPRTPHKLDDLLCAIVIGVWLVEVMTYGSPRWAECEEIAKAGPTKNAGVFLDRLPARDGYVHHDAPEHVMGFAPTRSGKAVGLVVPTLLSWPGSAVIHAGATPWPPR